MVPGLVENAYLCDLLLPCLLIQLVNLSLDILGRGQVSRAHFRSSFLAVYSSTLLLSVSSRSQGSLCLAILQLAVSKVVRSQLVLVVVEVLTEGKALLVRYLVFLIGS